MQLLESEGHGVALPAVPRVFLIEFLRLGEDIQAVVQSRVAVDVLVLVLVLDVYLLAQEDLEFDFLVSLSEVF